MRTEADSNHEQNNTEYSQHALENLPSYEEHMTALENSQGIPDGSQESINTSKTYQQKAAEKGYHQGEDGNWYKAIEDDWNEAVAGFNLDVEYPALADKIEDLADRFNLELSDGYDFKYHIYENAERLNFASDEHLENLVMARAVITDRFSNTEAKLVSYDETKLEHLVDSMGTYYQNVMDLLNSDSFPRTIGEVAESLTQHYNDRLVEGDCLSKLAEYAVRASQRPEGSSIILSGIERGLSGLADNEDNGSFFGDYMDYYSKLTEQADRPARYNAPNQVLLRYVRLHGVNDDTVSGFRDIIFPLIEQKDPVALPIAEGGNAYGMEPGTYGIADYTEECLLSRFEPAAINKLARIYHEIPTSDYAKFEQNRKDAMRLQGTIIGGRDFIHDEMPGTHEVLSAIRDFYENHDNGSAEFYRQRLRELDHKYHFGVLPNAFKIEAYEEPINYMAHCETASLGSPDERAIDILDRLIENTAPNLLHPPETQDQTLNQLMAKIEPIWNPETGEIKIDMGEVGPAVEQMNNIILAQFGQQGIMPSTISAVAYLDKMSTYALKNCEEKELLELPFDPQFKEIVRFSQLTSSTKYSKNDFESNYRKIIKQASEAYQDNSVDSNKVRDAYRSLHQWIVQNTSDLGKLYASRNVTKRFSGSVWSGNLSDALVGLFERV